MDTKHIACKTCWDTGTVLECTATGLECRVCCSEDDCGQVDCPDCTATESTLEAREVLGAHLNEMRRRVA